MRLILSAIPILLLCSACGGPRAYGNKTLEPGSSAPDQPSSSLDHADQAAVSNFLDAFHQAAAEADGEGYFGRMAKDGVFLGTDPHERWLTDDFQAAFASYFDHKESAWTYIPGRRVITVEGQHAWFDEDLSNANYGEVRGSGVLRRSGETWEIVQYNLHFTVPNEAAPAVMEAMRAHGDG